MSEFDNRVVGIQKSTLMDYPDKVAAILFYKGCNCHCPYCYNPDIVKGACTTLGSQEIKDFLKKRAGILDGIVFSGGECTIHNERLISDISYTKELGYSVKLDTNGTNPRLVEYLIERNLVDYIALDYKCHRAKNDLFFSSEDAFNNSMETLMHLVGGMSGRIPYEVRTTIHPDVLNETDISKMCEVLHYLGYKNEYFIQHFFNDGVANYLQSDLNKNPRNFSLQNVDTHNIRVVERNAKQNEERF